MGIGTELHHGSTTGSAYYAVGSLNMSAFWGVCGVVDVVIDFVRQLAVVLLLQGHWVHGWAIFHSGQGSSVSRHLEQLLVMLGHLVDLVAVAESRW